MLRRKSERLRDENVPRIFNAFTHEHYFDHDFLRPRMSTSPVTLDKPTVIDEIINANISRLTYRTRHE